MHLSNYKHIIWDWNGTLFDDVLLCCDIINGILKRRDLSQFSLEEYKNIFTFPVKEYYLRAGLDLKKYSFEKLSIEFIDEYEQRRKECSLYPGSVDMLEFISSQGITQSILSAYAQNTLSNIVKEFNLEKYFIRLVGLDNIYAHGKMENGRRWMNELGFQKGDVLFIGDCVHDFEVANEIGADCLLLSHGHQDKIKLVECKVPIFTSLNELMKNTT